MKTLTFLLFSIFHAYQLTAQPAACTFKEPVVTIDFGTGNIDDPNSQVSYNYRRVAYSCPTDGHYSYCSYTSDCFRSDWLTIAEDHTTGDVNGNFMLVNASPASGIFLSTAITGLKTGTTYEFGVWMMNVCKISDKCPFPLLPNITIRLQTRAGTIVAQFNTGDIARLEAPHWTQYRAQFTTPASDTWLMITMIDNSPGGCGNDFAIDDITFRECIISNSIVSTPPKSPTVIKNRKEPSKPTAIKTRKEPSMATAKKAAPAPISNQPLVTLKPTLQPDLPAPSTPDIKGKMPTFPSPPPMLTTRSNPLVKQIDVEAGEISVDLYDNGEIDGDSVSVYHNNLLLIAHAKLSQKPISFRIGIDAAHPHHELIMVAENLGSIPPNTSLMIITSRTKRYEVFISSTEQKNAKVVFDLKE